MAARMIGAARGLVENAIKTGTETLTKTTAFARSPRVQQTITLIRTELGPPKSTDMPAIKQGLNGFKAELQGFTNNTVKEAVIKIGVAFEVCCWFYIGEIIGRRSLIGYKFDL
eukprot:m.333548 g.333548  ORF g.333548 m.333548 type:complete len:113 (+) comp17170_c0_seq1:34-372(+)